MKKQFKENYEIVKKIGSGLTADVFEAKSKSHGRVSVKIVQPSFYNSKIGAQLIQNQVKILAYLEHKNVLKLIENSQINGKIHIVTEYCQGGDLQNYIRKNKTLRQKQVLSISKSIIEGLIYLKQKQIVHRDLKPSNIFLKDSQPIIADFGFAVQANDRNLMNINAGSPLYMSYESLVNKKFSEKSDIFSLGVCMFQMLTGRTPWSAKSQSQLILKLKSPPKLPSQIGNKMGKLILKCLITEASQRPHLQQILKNVIEIIDQKSVAPQTNQKKKESMTKITDIKINKSISMHVDLKKNAKNLKATQNKQNKPIQCNKKVRSITINQNKNVEKQLKKASLTSRPQAEFLSSVNPDQFTFLPPSVISKFKLILHNYKNVISSTKENSSPPVMIQEKDSLVLDMQKCKTEVQLCRCIQSFIRRLFRLTKNYKQHKNCLSSLQSLYERVTNIVI